MKGVIGWLFENKLSFVEFIFSALLFIFVALFNTGHISHLTFSLAFVIISVPCFYFRVKIINKEDL